MKLACRENDYDIEEIVRKIPLPNSLKTLDDKQKEKIPQKVEQHSKQPGIKTFLLWILQRI